MFSIFMQWIMYFDGYIIQYPPKHHARKWYPSIQYIQYPPNMLHDIVSLYICITHRLPDIIIWNERLIKWLSVLRNMIPHTMRRILNCVIEMVNISKMELDPHLLSTTILIHLQRSPLGNDSTYQKGDKKEMEIWHH